LIDHLPVLADLIPWFAAKQVRQRATLGGNIGGASPIGDLLPLLLALDADIVLRSLEGERVLAMADYFTGYRQTLRRDDEMIVAVRVPCDTALQTRFYKIAKRQTDDISIVASCFALRLNGEGLVLSARLAFGGVAATPKWRQHRFACRGSKRHCSASACRQRPWTTSRSRLSRPWHP